MTTFSAVAQSSETCATEELHAYRMRTDASYKTRHIANMSAIKARIQQEKLAPRQSPPVYTIPVVVHIIHLGENIGSGTNISDAQVLDAIDGLNDRYANENGMGIDIEINFCLANRDPNGCPTSGINRVDGSGVANYPADGIQYGDGCGADELEIKSLIAWPVDQYYNIWVVHDICGDVAGYAYYPNGEWFDGTVIDAPSMIYNSRVLAHELGHGLNLQHTFSGDDGGSECPNDNDCEEDGDEVCDTPPHKRNDCGLNNPCGSNGEWNDSRYNWMSYCPTDVEFGRFTDDQRTRMRATMLEWPRNSLPTSLGCSNAEYMRITSDNSLMCSGETRVLSATPAGGFFAIASGPGSVNGNVLTATAGGIIAVEYIVSLENCTSSVFQSINTKQAATARIITDDTLCVGQTTALAGLPAGGNFTVVSGPAEIDSQNVITTIGEGVIDLKYEVVRLGCLSTDESQVTAVQTPVAEIELLAEDLLSVVEENGLYQWLRCDADYEIIEGATEATYVVSASGSYAVEMRKGACRDTSACLLLDITSMEDGQHANHLKVYPNPVADVLFIEIENQQQPYSIAIADMQGKSIVLQHTGNQARTSIDVSSFATGVYVMSVGIGEERYFYRIIKL